jgi:hypothetical protein
LPFAGPLDDEVHRRIVIDLAKRASGVSPDIRRSRVSNQILLIYSAPAAQLDLTAFALDPTEPATDPLDHAHQAICQCQSLPL